MINGLKRCWLVAAVAIVNVGLMLSGSSLGVVSFQQASTFLWEVLQILPPVTILMGLFDVWVPRPLVEQNIGKNSGLRGILFAILLGTAAAGPIYAAFPVALSLLRKGARMANIGIFLGAWATIKLPMIIMESTFIGLRFAILRLAITLPGVIGVGILLERLVPLATLPPSKQAALHSLTQHDYAE